MHEEEDKGSSVFKITKFPGEMRSKMWFHDYRRNRYAKNKSCTVCGTKILFKQNNFFFKAQQPSSDNFLLPV